LKIKGPEDSLGACQASLWIDNSVVLRSDPFPLLCDWLDNAAIAIPGHSSRSSVSAEFDAVDTLGYDDPSRIYEQLIHYAAHASEALEEVPYWTGIIARRHNPETYRLMAQWWEHVLRYSRRDQLSLNYVAMTLGFPIRRVGIASEDSQWHRWPVCHNRDVSAGRTTLRDALRVPYARLGSLEAQRRRPENDNDPLFEALRATRFWGLVAPLRRKIPPWLRARLRAMFVSVKPEA